MWYGVCVEHTESEGETARNPGSSKREAGPEYEAPTSFNVIAVESQCAPPRAVSSRNRGIPAPWWSFHDSPAAPRVTMATGIPPSRGYRNATERRNESPDCSTPRLFLNPLPPLTPPLPPRSLSAGYYCLPRNGKISGQRIKRGSLNIIHANFFFFFVHFPFGFILRASSCSRTTLNTFSTIDL